MFLVPESCRIFLLMASNNCGTDTKLHHCKCWKCTEHFLQEQFDITLFGIIELLSFHCFSSGTNIKIAFLLLKPLGMISMVIFISSIKQWNKKLTKFLYYYCWKLDLKLKQMVCKYVIKIQTPVSRDIVVKLLEREEETRRK